MLQKLTSRIDRSVNYIQLTTPGKLEARYVHREGAPYFIVYLSSQTGCDQACRMCHLTATGQTKMRDATIEELVTQGRTVLQNCEPPEVEYLHYNFMARGEPLNNLSIRNDNQELFRRLTEEALRLGFSSKFLISTIMPKSLDRRLIEVFDGSIHPYVYYSLYSMRDSFRKRWLPKAMSPHLALEQLKEWSDHTNNKPKVHYAFIRGENDDERSVVEVCRALLEYGLAPDINIVRYNPYSPKQGEESPEEVVQANANVMRELLGSHVKIIPKVGYDVQASCGMFVR